MRLRADHPNKSRRSQIATTRASHVSRHITATWGGFFYKPEYSPPNTKIPGILPILLILQQTFALSLSLILILARRPPQTQSPKHDVDDFHASFARESSSREETRGYCKETVEKQRNEYRQGRGNLYTDNQVERAGPAPRPTSLRRRASRRTDHRLCGAAARVTAPQVG